MPNRKPKPLQVYVVDTRHNYTAEPSFIVATTLDEAAVHAHAHFEAYEFEVRDGKPFDPGNADDADGGFTCFDNVKMHGDLVLEFMHSGGDGPCCTVKRAPLMNAPHVLERIPPHKEA